MTVKAFIEMRAIKQSAIAEALKTSKACISYKVKHDAFTLFDITTLRRARLINLEDVDTLTR